MKIFLVMVAYLPLVCIAQSFETNNSTKHSFESAKIEINRLHVMLVKNPEYFARIAEEFSQDSGSFSNFGIIKRKMSLGSFDDAFRYYIKNLKIDEVSKPFETIFGWHIARVLSISSDQKYEIQHILIQYE